MTSAAVQNRDRPAFQRRGIGTAILRDLIRACSERQLPVRLSVCPHSPAPRLYQRLGFREVGTDSTSIAMQWDPPDGPPAP
jgi:GNAT superfamily N-acetyltransferase